MKFSLTSTTIQPAITKYKYAMFFNHKDFICSERRQYLLFDYLLTNTKNLRSTSGKKDKKKHFLNKY